MNVSLGRRISRRSFNKCLIGAAAATLVGGLAIAGCTKDGGNQQPDGQPQPQTDQPEPSAPTTQESTAAQGPKADPVEVFDMHADTVGPLGIADYEPYLSEVGERYHGDLVSNDCQIAAERLGGMRWAQCYAVWTPDDCPSASYHEFYRKGADWFLAQMAAYPDTFGRILDFRDVTAVLDEGKVAAILTVENSVALEEGLQMVDEFAADGVKIAGLTWNGKNVLGSGHKTPEGLTDLGRDYVRRLEECGIVVDVSHLNDAGFWDVAEIATRPFIATHSNARAVCNVPRNLDDDQFRVIVERGGLVGLNFYEGFVHAEDAAYDFDELIAHVEHWLDLGGENVIALGSDRDGSTVPDWLADCTTQPHLFDLVCERLGKEIGLKLFSRNAIEFFCRYEDQYRS